MTSTCSGNSQGHDRVTCHDTKRHIIRVTSGVTVFNTPWTFYYPQCAHLELGRLIKAKSDDALELGDLARGKHFADDGHLGRCAACKPCRT
eukprot:5523621-Pleurochrysis_carterae.AAC.1